MICTCACHTLVGKKKVCEHCLEHQIEINERFDLYKITGQKQTLYALAEKNPLDKIGHHAIDRVFSYLYKQAQAT